MNREISYTKSVSSTHIKAFGQYFTDDKVADFMCSWACKGADTVLDPAVGNSIFLSYARKYNPLCRLFGYEIDDTILDYFGNPSGANIFRRDYLLNGWDEKYDGIVCNPPYSRFQAINNRAEILESIYAHTGIQCSGNTNLYILFLIKSIFQLSAKGKLAYLIPSEFLNSKYGTIVKQLLLDQQLLRGIIHFENNNEMFFNATTTCCILLLDRTPKSHVTFYQLSSITELQSVFNNKDLAVHIEYAQLKAEEKWRSFIRHENTSQYVNLHPLSEFCSVSRGIATGSNDFFCFSLSKARQFGIPEHCLTKCICRSADIKSPIFSNADFDALSNADKTVYLLDISDNDSEVISSYIKYGEINGTSKKYLPSHRNPWYSMEQKPIAPIWVSSASRGKMKFVRNQTMAKALSTFHSVFVHEKYIEDTNLIFSYFLTPIAQTILRESRKILGNGLEKFQPNDLNTARTLCFPHSKT